jgi:hypothetical protein
MVSLQPSFFHPHFQNHHFSSEKLHGKCCGIGIWKGDVIEILILESKYCLMYHLCLLALFFITKDIDQILKQDELFDDILCIIVFSV